MSFAAGLSGLAAASQRLDAAAWNVARAASQRVGTPPAAGAAIAGPVPGAPGAAPAPIPAATNATASSGPPVDLVRDMVETISASRAVLANLQTIRRTDEALASLLEPAKPQR